MLPRNHRITTREIGKAQSAADARHNRVALLLAGGDGTRLQELTCQIAGVPIPKQYCRLLHGNSMLEATISRARMLVPITQINVILNWNHLDLAKDQVSKLPKANIIVQPLNRDTGPGMIFALLQLQRTCGDATVAVFPTDHYIDKGGAFIAHVMRAIIAVSSLPEKIVILGVVPDRPETGYGYILPSCALRRSGKMYQVGSFVEKPDSIAAREIIVNGGLWNTFVLVFRLSRMLKLVKEVVPDEVEKLYEICEKPNLAADLYRTIQPWNFSTHVLARIPQHLIVLQVGNVSWSDWGTRESIERTYRSLNLEPFWNLAKAGESRGAVDDQAPDLPEIAGQ